MSIWGDIWGEIWGPIWSASEPIPTAIVGGGYARNVRHHPKRKEIREDLIAVIRVLSPTPAIAERIVGAVERSTMAKLATPAGTHAPAPILALPESLRAIFRQAIKVVEEREQEEMLLLL